MRPDAKHKHKAARTHEDSYIRVCILIQICTHMFKSFYFYVCTYIHTYIHTYIRTYIHTYIHTYIYIYIITRMHRIACMHVLRPWPQASAACVRTHRAEIAFLNRQLVGVMVLSFTQFQRISGCKAWGYGSESEFSASEILAEFCRFSVLGPRAFR